MFFNIIHSGCVSNGGLIWGVACCECFKIAFKCPGVSWCLNRIWILVRALARVHCNKMYLNYIMKCVTVILLVTICESFTTTTSAKSQSLSYGKYGVEWSEIGRLICIMRKNNYSIHKNVVFSIFIHISLMSFHRIATRNTAIRATLLNTYTCIHISL